MTTARKRTTPLAAAAARVPIPVGKWAQILAKPEVRERIITPFEVYDGLTLQPMTPARSRKFSDSRQAYFASLAAIANAVRDGAVDELPAMQKQSYEALDAVNEALFGERELALVDEYFAGQGNDVKDLFLEQVQKHFLRLPDDGTCGSCGRDGVCPHCGKHDNEATEGSDTPGEGQGESPTSSSITGSNSTETSPTTSPG